MSSNDPKYQRKYFASWYEKNKERHKATCSVNREKRVKENQRNLLSYLYVHPCVDCNERDPVVLQFDHVRGKKFKEIGRMMACAWRTILKEIAKCEVRCANCHIRRTMKVQKSYKVR